MGVGTYVNIDEHANFNIEDPYDLVNAKFDITQQYANDAFTATMSYMTSLGSMLGALEVPDTNLDDVNINTIVGLDYIKRPTVGDVNLDGEWPDTKPILSAMVTVPEVSTITLPTLSLVPPNFTNVDKPELADLQAPSDVPVINQTLIPTAPSLSVPDAPIFDEIPLPPPPSISLPSFDEKLPDQILQAPEGFSYQEGEYQSDIFTVTVKKILNDITNGGTGLDVTVEKELFDRAVTRQSYENEKLIQQAEDMFPSFDMPQGALQGALLEAGAQVSRNVTEVNVSILVEQANLAQNNTQFMVERGVQMDSILREFFNNQSNRAFEASKTVATIGIEIFNARVTEYNAYLEAYKSSALVYETKIKASLIELDIFKSQIESAKVSVEVQGLLADIYGKQLIALETQMKLYVSEMEGAKIASDVEAKKLELFGLQIENYVAQLKGEQTKFDVYTAELGGEKVKAEVYDSQVQGFLGEVQAVKIGVEAESLTSEIALKQNALLIEEYKAGLMGYASEIDLVAKQISAKLSGFEAEVSAYNAETSAEASYYQTKAKEIDLFISEAGFKLNKAVAELEATIKGYTSVKSLQVEGTKGIMSVGAQLSSSAMNAVNASASVGYSGSESRGESWGHNEGLSEGHNFNETTTG